MTTRFICVDLFSSGDHDDGYTDGTFVYGMSDEDRDPILMEGEFLPGPHGRLSSKAQACAERLARQYNCEWGTNA